MNIKKLHIATNLDLVKNKENKWSDVFVTLDDD